jgi:O-acetyl-ADP-ribose deacetylase (regulator of RNase III)
MWNIEYVYGDATEPLRKNITIAHVVNNVGKFGAGFSGALERRYPRECAVYRKCWNMYDGGDNLIIYNAKNEVTICHMFAMNGVRSAINPVPLNMDWLGRCLHGLKEYGNMTWGETIQMPRIGAGLAGGEWGKIAQAIREELLGMKVFVLDLPPNRGGK